MKKLKRLYMIAGFFSIVLYIAGVGTGYFLQGDLSDVLEGELVDVRNEISLVEQELPLLSLEGEGSCAILSTLSNDVSGRLSSILNTLTELDKRGASGDTYERLLNDYTALAVRGWILGVGIDNKCSEQSVPVLYFYSVPCDDCVEQGMILDDLREKYSGKVSVFVLNADVGQPAVNVLTRSFNITKTPSMIIDSKVYQGKVGKDELDQKFCTLLEEC